MTTSARPRRRGFARELWLVVLVALAVAATAYAVSRPQPRVQASGTSAVSVPTEAPRPVTSLWFGDSIVEGCCRSAASSPRMAEVAARRLGWAQPVVVGAGGTGYLTSRTRDGIRVGPYPERIKAAVDGAYYDVVVVAGGNNDATRAFDPGKFEAAVRTVLQQVRSSLPEAHIVLLGPYSPTGQGYVEQRRIERAEAQRVGAAFIDQVAQGWMRGRPNLLHTDEFHPNDAGQTHLGVQVAAALREVLPPDVAAPASATRA
ncbi:MAG: SGNH/GDSL hydrolase family protein [Actinomycetota bacterium]|nr:SGNH/GDSL hydrolase family protein [Actinomycetota bacterium]